MLRSSNVCHVYMLPSKVHGLAASCGIRSLFRHETPPQAVYLFVTRQQTSSRWVDHQLQHVEQLTFQMKCFICDVSLWHMFYKRVYENRPPGARQKITLQYTGVAEVRQRFSGERTAHSAMSLSIDSSKLILVIQSNSSCDVLCTAATTASVTTGAPANAMCIRNKTAL